ncbi:MAG: YcaO-like family protein [Haloarculaceae archaeon]
MTIHLVGDGPASEAVAAALGDSDAQIARSAEPSIADATLAVVVGASDSGVFERANEQALAGGTPWLAVEIGGIGGLPAVDASVAGLGPGACYDCLAGRVAANTDDAPDSDGAPSASTARFAGAVAGRLAVDAISGGDLVGTVVELPHRERQFLPLPGCSCGDHDRGAIRRGFEDVPLDAAVQRGEYAVDDRVGIVSEVGEASSFPTPYYLAQLCDTSGFSDATAARQAAGVAVDWNAAFMKAIGEGLERYSAGVYREADLDRATAAELARPVGPSAFVTPDADFDAGAERLWTPAVDLDTDQRVQVPASMVYYPPPGEQYRPPVTTGLGLGNSTDEALLAGLYEVIERDATMLSWYSTYEPLGLDVDADTFETLERRAAAENLTVTPLLLTQDVDVPVVGVAVHREEWPRFAVGSAADLDPNEAAVSALAEAIQNWMELETMGPEQASEESGAIGTYADFPEQARDLVAVDGTVPADSVGPDEPPTGAAELDALVSRVADAGLDVCAARLTTRDLAALGFESVRVLVPSAQPLFFDDPFFGERARTVPETLGFEPRLDRQHHPYP